jgi:(2R)-3-sulfolactate dehydrogenase (NADP+)
MSETVLLSLPELEALMTRALLNARVSAENARSVARALAFAEAEGHTGHGLSRVPSYAAQARSGKVDGYAVPQARQTRSASLAIDAARGFAYPALDLATAGLPPLARACGIAIAGITRSHHCGVAGHPCALLAEAGLVALAFANTPSAMTPWGGRRPLFGTNPIAFAAPCKGRSAIVIDLALSEVARGKIAAAARRGEAIPTGWALDAAGQPTTDATAAMHGALVPSGGAKGAALALMVEILAAALTGANFASEASSFFEAEGPSPSVGQLLVAIDPAAFAGLDALTQRIADLAHAIETDNGARVPGARRAALRQKASREGLTVEARLHAQVRALADG